MYRVKGKKMNKRELIKQLENIDDVAGVDTMLDNDRPIFILSIIQSILVDEVYNDAKKILNSLDEPFTIEIKHIITKERFKLETIDPETIDILKPIIDYIFDRDVQQVKDYIEEHKPVKLWFTDINCTILKRSGVFEDIPQEQLQRDWDYVDRIVKQLPLTRCYSYTRCWTVNMPEDKVKNVLKMIEDNNLTQVGWTDMVEFGVRDFESKDIINELNKTDLTFNKRENELRWDIQTEKDIIIEYIKEHKPKKIRILKDHIGLSIDEILGKTISITDTGKYFKMIKSIDEDFTLKNVLGLIWDIEYPVEVESGGISFVYRLFCQSKKRAEFQLRYLHDLMTLDLNETDTFQTDKLNVDSENCYLSLKTVKHVKDYNPSWKIKRIFKVKEYPSSSKTMYLYYGVQ